MRYLKFLGVLLILVEMIARIFVAVSFQTSLLTPDLLKDNFYPELDFELNENKASILILGGSVLYNEIIPIELNGISYETSFCALSELNSSNLEVINLAQPGHNTMDSWYKYEYLKNQMFDYVFLYHGINDTRANNWPADKFDKNYRHIEFYDDLYVVQRHPELPFITAFFTFDWFLHTVAKKNKNYLPKELFTGLLSGSPEDFLLFGSQIKTESTFERNVKNVISLSEQKTEMLVISTYAYYAPDNYSYEAFKAQELDYDQQIFPTELYGLPENVVKGLMAHNAVINELATLYPAIYMIDIEQEIPRSSEYFDDICHLTENGCALLGHLLEDVVLNNK